MKIIDVRSKGEFEQSHVAEATWFDVARMMEGEMPHFPKDEHILLYCRSGARSSTAAFIMKQHGFTNVSSGGGLGQMGALGYKIVR